MNRLSFVVVNEFRVEVDPNGRYWASEAIAALLDRYRTVASLLNLVVRVQPVASPHPSYTSIGPDVDVKVTPLTMRRGFLGALEARLRAPGVAKRCLRDDSLTGLVVRVPSTAGRSFARIAARAEIPFFAEVVGDPAVALSALPLPGPAAQIVARRAARETCQIVKGASAVLYVTERYLQERYPARPGVPSAAASNVELDAEWFRRPSVPAGPLSKIVATANLEFPYKGIDVLIESLAQPGLESVELTVVGSGVLLDDLRVLASGLSLAERVTFVGRLDHSELRALYATSDLFVLASRSEGMPRAMLEAMAFGLPVVATDVGGVAEVIHPDDLVVAGDTQALADGIRRMMDSDVRFQSASRNHETATRFAREILMQRRIDMLREFADLIRHKRRTAAR